MNRIHIEYKELPLYHKISLNINFFILDLYFSIKHLLHKI